MISNETLNDLIIIVESHYGMLSVLNEDDPGQYQEELTAVEKVLAEVKEEMK